MATDSAASGAQRPNMGGDGLATAEPPASFKCRICQHTEPSEHHVALEMMYGTREAFDYFRCPACDCLQIGDIPQDLGHHYPHDYYSQQARDESEMPSGLKGAIIRWYCRSAVAYPAGKLGAALRSCLPVPTDFSAVGAYLAESRLRSPDERILDVGCGASPHRLAAMRRCGFALVEGVDPFVAQDAIYHGVPVAKRTIDQVTGRFGLIMFHHSLEHVPDPVAALRAAASLLRPGGTCLVRIPTMGTYFWRTFGVNWVELDAPRHLHLMSVRTIEIMAGMTGFAVRKIIFDSEGWEIAASLRYQDGIPLRDAEVTFSPEQLTGFEQEAQSLNQRGDGGRACFYLERI